MKLELLLGAFLGTRSCNYPNLVLDRIGATFEKLGAPITELDLPIRFLVLVYPGTLPRDKRPGSTTATAKALAPSTPTSVMTTINLLRSTQPSTLWRGSADLTRTVARLFP